MSRHEKDLGEDTLSVGWDEPMKTFFAQVRVNQADDDLRDLPLKLWLGGVKNEYPDLDGFVQEVEKRRLRAFAERC